MSVSGPLTSKLTVRYLLVQFFFRDVTKELPPELLLVLTTTPWLFFKYSEPFKLNHLI
jgi:hypothetical protein